MRQVVARWFVRRFSSPLRWIKEKNLVKAARALRDERIAQHGAESMDEGYLTYGLAAKYNMEIFGEDWARQVFAPSASPLPKRLRAGRKYARAESAEDTDRYRHMQRALQLAEIVFNLRKVEGIGGLLAGLRQGKIEPTFAELEAGSFLARRGIPCHFVLPKGQKGDDYDILIPRPTCCPRRWPPSSGTPTVSSLWSSGGNKSVLSQKVAARS
jgi:hypothetical protein